MPIDFSNIQTTRNRGYIADNIAEINAALWYLPAKQRAGIIGSIIEESGGNPLAKSKNGTYQGLLQWGADRYKIQSDDPNVELANQIAYLKKSLNNTSDHKSWTDGGKGSGYKSYKDTYNAFNSSVSNLGDSFRAFSYGYVRPQGKEKSFDNRFKVVQQVYDRIKDNDLTKINQSLQPDTTRVARPPIVLPVKKKTYEELIHTYGDGGNAVTLPDVVIYPSEQDIKDFKRTKNYFPRKRDREVVYGLIGDKATGRVYNAEYPFNDSLNNLIDVYKLAGKPGFIYGSGVPIDSSRAYYNPFLNQIHSGSDYDNTSSKTEAENNAMEEYLIPELSHGLQNTLGPSNVFMQMPAFSKDSKAYNNPKHYEYKAHQIIEPLINKYIDGTATYTDLVSGVNSTFNKKAEGGNLNFPNKWDDLTMTQKSDVMAAAVRNGITKLQDIRDKWNEFAEGGSMDDDNPNELSEVEVVATYPHEDRVIETMNNAHPEFLERLRNNDTRAIQNPDGTSSTHVLGSADNIVFPAIQDVNGQLVDYRSMPWESAMRMAVDNNDYIEFPTEGDARYFGEHYKKYFPQFFGNQFKSGGYIPSKTIKDRIALWEGDSMKTNRSFDVEAKDFNRVIPQSVRSKLNQQQLDALYSYGYNVGMGNLKKRVLPTLQNYVNDRAGAADVASSMWASRDNEKGMSGLRKRRDTERSMFVGSSPLERQQSIVDTAINMDLSHLPSGNAYQQPVLPPNPTDYGTPVDYSTLIRTEEPKDIQDEVFKDDGGLGLLSLISSLGGFGEKQQQPLADYVPQKRSPFVISAPTNNNTLLDNSWFAEGGYFYDDGGQKGATIFRTPSGSLTTESGHPVEALDWDENGYRLYRDAVTGDLGHAYEPSEAATITEYTPMTRYLASPSGRVRANDKPLEEVYPEFDLVGFGGAARDLSYIFKPLTYTVRRNVIRPAQYLLERAESSLGTPLSVPEAAEQGRQAFLNYIQSPWYRQRWLNTVSEQDADNILNEMYYRAKHAPFDYGKTAKQLDAEGVTTANPAGHFSFFDAYGAEIPITNGDTGMKGIEIASDAVNPKETAFHELLHYTSGNAKGLDYNSNFLQTSKDMFGNAVYNYHNPMTGSGGMVIPRGKMWQNKILNQNNEALPSYNSIYDIVMKDQKAAENYFVTQGWSTPEHAPEAVQKVKNHISYMMDIQEQRAHLQSWFNDKVLPNIKNPNDASEIEQYFINNPDILDKAPSRVKQVINELRPGSLKDYAKYFSTALSSIPVINAVQNNEK